MAIDIDKWLFGEVDQKYLHHKMTTDSLNTLGSNLQKKLNTSVYTIYNRYYK